MMDIIFLGNKMGAALKKVGWLVARLNTCPARLEAITWSRRSMLLLPKKKNTHMSELVQVVSSLVGICLLIQVHQLLQRFQLNLFMTFTKWPISGQWTVYVFGTANGFTRCAGNCLSQSAKAVVAPSIFMPPPSTCSSFLPRILDKEIRYEWTIPSL